MNVTGLSMIQQHPYTSSSGHIP